jgi:hypothetical protein
MGRSKLTYIQRATRINELLVQLDAICSDDHKKISDYTQSELVEEASYCLDKLTEDLNDDSFADDISYNKKQIRMLRKYLNDFS